LKLDVKLRTPTPLQQNNDAWEATTPRNARKVESRSKLIRKRMQIYRVYLANPLDDQVKQLSRGA
jgi:hypothetical protein